MEGPAVKDLETVFLNSLIANQEHIPIEYERLVSLSLKIFRLIR